MSHSANIPPIHALGVNYRSRSTPERTARTASGSGKRVVWFDHTSRNRPFVLIPMILTTQTAQASTMTTEESSLLISTVETPASFLARVNNKAASELIPTGNLKSAFFGLQNAIRLLSFVFSCDGAQQQRDEDDSLLAESSADIVRIQGVSSPGCDSYGMVPNAGMIGYSYRIHNIEEITSHPLYSPVDQQRILQQVACVTIFNMALVCHLQVLETSSCRAREGLLKRSMFLYNQVFQVWDDEASPLYLSLCQNCLVISLENGNIQDANLWKGRLTHAIGRHYPVCPLSCVIYESATFAASLAA